MPFCPYDGRQVGLWYLAAAYGDTTSPQASWQPHAPDL